MGRLQTKYLTSKISPLMNSKLLKGQLVVEFFKVYPCCHACWMPPRPNRFKNCICFIKCYGILVIVANFHVFCFQTMHMNEFISVNFHKLNPMENISSFFVGQWLQRASIWAKHNSHNITICLNNIWHGPFELWHMNSIHFHDLHKGPPHKNLKFHIL